MQTISLVPLSSAVEARVSMPGSKSYTNRALIMASLIPHAVTISNALESDDTTAMIECLRTLGIAIEKDGKNIVVVGSVTDVGNGTYNLNARLSGTTIRFILALACIVPGVKIISGEGRLNERPIKDLVDGLRQLGASIEYVRQEGYPPLRVLTSPLKKNSLKMPGGVSSQYFSALLMIAPAIGDLTIDVEDDQISKSYIEMTIAMMKEWGVSVSNHDYERYHVDAGQQYSMKKYAVEGDYSAAGYFAAIAALTGSTITIDNLNPHSAQGDLEFIKILERSGNTVEYGAHEITIIGSGVSPQKVDMELCPDQAQTLAVLSAFAPGVTTLTGVRSLRVKETERVKAVQAELAKMDIRTESPDDDTLIIYGGDPKSAIIDTYHDHRMAMSFAVAGAKIDGMQINDPEVVNKTFPSFWEVLQTIGVTVKKI